MPIFDLNNFNHRKVIKLAPDAFITLNGALGGRIVTSMNKNNTQDVDIQGGIVSINATSTVTTPGAGKANIQIVAPEYTGIHSRDSSSSDGYWVTLPSGVKIPYIIPMMELQIFMKGRYLFKKDGIESPVYYRVFWGFVSEVTEQYHDGNNTISVQCTDMLGWWKYQKLNLSPNEYSAVTGGAGPAQYPTLFRGDNPWQIMVKLLYETQWKSPDGKATYAFVQTNPSKFKIQPIFGPFPDSTEIGALAVTMTEYWRKRFNFFGEAMQVEMFGLTKKINMSVLTDPKTDAISSTDNKSDKNSAVADTPEASAAVNSKNDAIKDESIAYDYNLLARVLPFGDYDLYAVGGQSLELTKLEIAQKVCESVHMELFVDTNGSIVFKPPFYNLDVTGGDVPYYRIEASEVISYSSGLNTDAICTYLELTAPQSQTVVSAADLIAGVHVDWDLMTRYGLRYQKGNVQYGNDATSLSLIAAAEMARINSEATTGQVSIPLRPEMRMGYPVYIAHKDTYYYVTGITHSFNFGFGATTDLALTAKRERIYDFTGEIMSDIKTSDTKTVSDVTGGVSSRVLKGFVQKFIEATEFSHNAISDPSRHNADITARDQQDVKDPETFKKKLAKDNYLRQIGSIAGPKFNGVYKIVPAAVSSKSISDTEQANPNVGAKTTIVSNQLLMITKNTIPYTDIKGYRHIGAFPYGANMVLRNNTMTQLNDNVSSVQDNTTSAATQDPGGVTNNQAPVNANFESENVESNRADQQNGSSMPISPEVDAKIKALSYGMPSDALYGSLNKTTNAAIANQGSDSPSYVSPFSNEGTINH